MLSTHQLRMTLLEKRMTTTGILHADGRSCKHASKFDLNVWSHICQRTRWNVTSGRRVGTDCSHLSRTYLLALTSELRDTPCPPSSFIRDPSIWKLRNNVARPCRRTCAFTGAYLRSVSQSQPRISSFSWITICHPMYLMTCPLNGMSSARIAIRSRSNSG